MRDLHRLDVDEEFEKMLDPLTQLEFDQLRENIRRDGCIDPIRVWRRTVVDGHNRYKICLELGIPFEIEEINFIDRMEVKKWIAANQLGRRNLSLHRKRYYRGLIVKGEYEKKNVPTPKNRGKKLMRGKDGKSPNDPWRTTKEEIREELSLRLNVSPRTLRRDVKMAEALDKIHPSLRTILLDSAYESTASDVLFIADLSQETHRLILESIRRSGTKNIRLAMQPVLAGKEKTLQEVEEKINDPEFMTKAHWNAKLDVISGGCVQLVDSIPKDLKKEWAILVDHLRKTARLAKAMRWYRRCPNCNGDGCDVCGYHGYVTRETWKELGNDPSTG